MQQNINDLSRRLYFQASTVTAAADPTGVSGVWIPHQGSGEGVSDPPAYVPQ